MAKYPSPDEAEKRFREGVDAARDKWVSRTVGASTIYRLWYTGFANEIYPIIAGLPDKTGVDPAENYRLRGAPVAVAVKRLSRTYRATRIEQARKLAATLPAGR
jgi:hypothetical protein